MAKRKTPIKQRYEFYCFLRILKGYGKWLSYFKHTSFDQNRLYNSWYRSNYNKQSKKQMQKSEVSTSSDHSTVKNPSKNEAHLIQLVRNLELELGYHAIALKKAEQMIKLLQNDNSLLKNENQMLRGRCKDLEFKIVKYENQLSALSQSSSNAQYAECFSAGLQRRNYLEPHSAANIDRNLTASTRSISKKVQKCALDPETPMRKKEKNETKPNRLTHQPVTLKQNQVQLTSTLKQKRKQIEQKSPIKTDTKSYSFIPFQQLQFRSNWH